MNNRQFKVDFFCVGVAKAGTTTLHDLLCMQENISLPKRKETNYFSFGIHGKPEFSGPLDSTSVNEPTIVSFQEYMDDFDLDDGNIVGEICPSYMLEGTVERIYEHNADAKIIILLREPVGRAISNYQHLVRDGRERLDLEQSLEAEEARLASGWEWFWGIKQNSQYFSAVNAYINKFGEQNVKIIFFEDFIKNQPQYIEEIFDFVGLDPTTAKHEVFDSNKSGIVSGRWRFVHRLLLSEGLVNSVLRKVMPAGLRKSLGALFKKVTTVKGEVSTDTKERLAQEFESDLLKLNELVGGNVGKWLEQRNVS